MKHSIPLRSSFAALVALLACDAHEPTVDSRAIESLDLSRFGVEEIVAKDGGFALLDADGQRLGHVAVGLGDDETVIDVDFDGRSAEVSWNDGQSELRCDGEETLVAGADGDAWEPQDAGTSACDEALELGFTVATAEGATPPWAEAHENEWRMAPGPNTSYGTCSSVSTWVGGSSCWSCAQAASSAFGRGPGWTEVSSSCSSGTLWTSCSATYCI